MIVVDFLRHGETESEGALLGRTDPLLSALGRDTLARQIARQSAGRAWEAIVASPLERAKASATIAAGVSGRTIEIDAGWSEIDFGDWDGCALSDLALDPRLAAFYANPDHNPPPNGETMQSVRTRVTSALGRIVSREAGLVLVVAHGGTIRVALSVLLAVPLERLWAIRIACGTVIRVEVGEHPSHGLWGELIGIVQPQSEGDA
jgi:alpha-ribazole phosphatase